MHLLRRLSVVLVAIVLFISVVPQAQAALTETQIQAILSLLSSFNADAATVSNVSTALRSQTSGGGSSTYCPQLTSALYRGQTDARTNGQVTQLQQFLVQHLGAPVEIVTGSYGPLTEQYVRQFQAKNGLGQYGNVGPQTRAAIAKVCDSVISPPTTETSFTASPTSGAAPLNVTFRITSLPSAGAPFTINFGHRCEVGPCGATVSSVGSEARTTYTSPGTYTAQLINASGNTLSSQVVTVSGLPLANNTRLDVKVPASVMIGSTYSIQWRDLTGPTLAELARAYPTATGELIAYNSNSSLGVAQTIGRNIPITQLLQGSIPWLVGSVTNDGRPMPAGTYSIALYVGVPNGGNSTAIAQGNSASFSLVSSTTVPPSATINQSSLTTSNSTALITGTAQGTQTISLALFNQNGVQVFSSTSNVVQTNGSWAVAVSPGVGIYTVKVYDSNKNTLATGTFTLSVPSSVATSLQITSTNVSTTTSSTVVLPTLTFSAMPSIITSGRSTSIIWAATNATSCMLGGGAPATLANAVLMEGTSGTVMTPALANNLTLSITCSGPGGSITKSVTITVIADTSGTYSQPLLISKQTSFGDQNVVAGAKNVKLASFAVQNTASGSINLANIVLTLGGAANISNLKLKDPSTGAQLGVTVAAPIMIGVGGITFGATTVIIPGGAIKIIDVYGDINSTATGKIQAGVHTDTTGRNLLDGLSLFLAAAVPLQMITIAPATNTALQTTTSTATATLTPEQQNTLTNLLFSFSPPSLSFTFNRASLAMIGQTVPSTTQSSGLLDSQVNSMIAMLQSFGASASIQNNMKIALSPTVASRPPLTTVPPGPTLLKTVCSASGNQATLSWNEVYGATSYGVRLDYTANNSSTCEGKINAGSIGYLCDSRDKDEKTTGASVTYTVTPNAPYTWSVRSMSSVGESVGNGTVFTCAL